MPQASAQPLDKETLQSMKEHLIGEDFRLVRHSATPETVELQNDVCPIAIPHIYESLRLQEEEDETTASPEDESETYITALKLRTLAAEVLTLCTTDNPTNRKAIAELEEVHISLKHLLDEGLKLWKEGETADDHAKMDFGAQAMGYAAQAVWILAYNDETNIQKFTASGIIDSLLYVMNGCDIDFDEAEEKGYQEECSFAVMWTLAALQNLAATYCETEDGQCTYVWNHNHNMLELSQDTPESSKIGHHTRFKMIKKIQQYGLKKRITRLVCGGPVHKPNSDKHPWPGTSTNLEDHKYRTSIVPWAAAGFIKNLALDPRIRVEWYYNWDMFECLCDMHYTSPDWLEEAKATAALHHLGWTAQCPQIYDHCEDVEGWNATEDGSSCHDYDEGRYCASHGHWTDAQGRSANDSCCICGGGIDIRKHGDEL
jgi:hypothetical protein